MKRNLLPMVAVFASLLALPVVSVTAHTAPQDRPEAPKIIRKSGGVLQTSATRRVEPIYPPLAKTARVSGSVVVEVTVDEEGKVIAARAISGHPLLKDAAVTAARGWQFTPTTLNGVPVKVIGTITLNFEGNWLASQFADGDLHKRVEELQQQIATDPKNAGFYYALGWAYADLFENKKALEAYKQALGLRPDFGEAQIGVADMLARMHRSDEAIAAYQQALTHDLTVYQQAAAYKIIAYLHSEANRHQEAVEALKQAIAISGDTSTHFDLGVMYLKIGDRDSAMREYDFLKEKMPPLADHLLLQINRQ